MYYSYKRLHDQDTYEIVKKDPSSSLSKKTERTIH